MKRSDNLPAPAVPDIELVLFENDAENARRLVEQGLSAFLVDTEVLGKDHRQLGFDTEIRPGSFDDLAAIAAIPGVTAWCRINGFGDHTANEVDAAVAAGADVLLLPMVKTLTEAKTFLELVGRRCRAAIMIETPEAASIAREINPLGYDYAFFGLNDFAIGRGGGSIFRALTDGSVHAARRALPDLRFGVGGLTDMTRGHPIPSIRLLEELENLRCAFTFLRRSFRRDAQTTAAGEIVAGIRAHWRRCTARSQEQRDRDHRALVAIVDGL